MLGGAHHEGPPLSEGTFRVEALDILTDARAGSAEGCPRSRPTPNASDISSISGRGRGRPQAVVHLAHRSHPTPRQPRRRDMIIASVAILRLANTPRAIIVPLRGGQLRSMTASRDPADHQLMLPTPHWAQPSKLAGLVPSQSPASPYLPTGTVVPPDHGTAAVVLRAIQVRLGHRGSVPLPGRPSRRCLLVASSGSLSSDVR
jgi:hypothetical protein